MFNFSAAALIGETQTDLSVSVVDSATDRYAKSTDAKTGNQRVAFNQTPTLAPGGEDRVRSLADFITGAFREGGIEMAEPFRARVRFVEVTVLHKPPLPPGGHREITGTVVTLSAKVPTDRVEAAKNIVGQLQTSIPAYLTAAPQ